MVKLGIQAITQKGILVDTLFLSMKDSVGEYNTFFIQDRYRRVSQMAALESLVSLIQQMIHELQMENGYLIHTF